MCQQLADADEWYPVYYCKKCEWNNAHHNREIKETLKQWAIAIVKEIDNAKSDKYGFTEATIGDIVLVDIPYEQNDLGITRNVIMTLFELTEDDLKS